jgi:four helix bundle protein
VPEIISFRDLEAWRLAMDLAELVYAITKQYPVDERFGLSLHTRKTAVSVPSNLAEGTRRRLAGYIARVVDATAEHAELESQVILADRLHYVSAADMKAFNGLSGSVGRLTHGLLRSLEAKFDRESAGTSTRHLSRQSER